MIGTITRIKNGVVVEKRELGLGSKVERFIGKIPGVKKLPCYDENGQLKSASGCGKVKKRLNDGEPIIPTIIKRITGK